MMVIGDALVKQKVFASHPGTQYQARQIRINTDTEERLMVS